MPGSRSAALSGLLILAATIFAAVPAQAAAPSNDDFDAAAVITSLPYSDASSTVEATTSPDDPSCWVGSGANVWYAYTPSADTWIEVNTAGSDFDTVLTAVSGDRGALTLIDCSDDSQYGVQSALVLHALAGTTYHFMVNGFGGDTGAVAFNARETTPPLSNVTVRLDDKGTVDRQGLVTVHGTAVCDGVGRGEMNLYAAQSNRRFTSTSSARVGFDCGLTATSWSASFASQTGVAFVPGSVSVTYDAWVSDDRGGNASTSGQRTVTLVGVR
jgi:hypothetical protein